MIPISRPLFLVVLLACATGAAADDKTMYEERVANRLTTLFQSLDRDADGVLTRAEAQGDLDLGPRFSDMDINSDGTVTRDELERYITQRYRVQPDNKVAESRRR